MFDLNVLQIWENNDFKVPFIVRRHNWGNNFGLMIIKAEFKKYPYGDAFGYSLPPINGGIAEPSWGTFNKPKNIKCRGCYQWERVDNMPSTWAICYDNEIKRSQLFKMEIIRTEKGNYSSLKMTSLEENNPFFRMKEKGLIGS